MKKLLILGMIALLAGCKGPKSPETTEPESYSADWESLAKHKASPEWFQDAKLGIYFHWGVYSVPAYGSEWYPRLMHFENTKEYKHHLETYGHPSEFGYHDFVPMFKAEFFDAEEWADLFQKAGARFAGPVAEHHDGFSMWDSDATPWNAADMGPKKDITGLLAAELKKRDMKLITTFHHAKQLQRFDSTETGSRTEGYELSHYPFFKGMPPASDDEKLKYLYGNIPAEQWYEEIWYAKLKEVIDQYQPDIIWFDYVLDAIPEEYRQKFSAYYLNEAEKWDKEVVIVRKQEDLPINYTVDDLEKSRKNRIGEEPWMTDETISKGSWCYTENLEIKTSTDVLHVLIDIVSKNGILLLNVSPMANGIIPENQKEVLLDMGAWLDKYGESIYETRPWYTFGEGPTKEPEGHFKNHQEFLKIKYSAKDVRYTTKGDVIYATLLGWPGNGESIGFTAFAPDSLPAPLEIASVSLLGSADPLDWNVTEKGLSLTTPEEAPDQMAVVFKIETR
ncbi:MAG: alpha-L-fucosidase [Bacteroidia bacterium]|nr:MAG: alpha-L-fucosidase [Bacteroidia bacterium]